MTAHRLIIAPTPDTTDDSQHPAALAFHALNDSAQILRGEALDPDEIARALELVEEGTLQLGAVYFASIRHERAAAELKQSVISLTRQLDDATAFGRALCGAPTAEDLLV